MSIRNFKRLKSRGDTLVEVMIAIGIITFLIAGAYSITRQSLNDDRRSQELGEALQLAQSQTENLKDYLLTNSIPTQKFCIQNNVAIPLPSSGISPGSQCAVNSADNMTSTEPIYNIFISPPSGASTTFTIESVWDDVDTGGQDNVTLYYQLYKQ